MNFNELQQEFFDRGTDYLSEDADGVARAQRWLNQAYREILNLQAWPFLKVVTTATPTGSPPVVSIPDLKRIRWVRLSGGTTPLRYATVEELVNDDEEDLSRTGTPESYYLVSDTLIAPFPATTQPLEIGYVKRVAPMSGTDTPVFDEEYHNLIVDKAMIRAYIDSDNFEAAAALKQVTDESLASMAEDYEVQSMQPRYISVDTTWTEV